MIRRRRFSHRLLTTTLVSALSVAGLTTTSAAAPGGCFRSLDKKWSQGGDLPRWDSLLKPVPHDWYNGSNAGQWQIDPDDPARMFASDGATVARSLDGGCTWEDVWSVDALPNIGGNATQDSWGHPVNVNRIDLPGSRHAPGRVYIRTTQSFKGSTLLVSNDDGVTFQRADAGLPAIYEIPGRGVLDGFEFAPSDPRTIYALIDPLPGGNDPLGKARFYGIPVELPLKLYRSRDAGSSWEFVSDMGPEGQYSFDKIQVDRFDPEEVWVASRSFPLKLQFSEDGGQRWTNVMVPDFLRSSSGLALFRSSPKARTWVLLMDGFGAGVFSPDGGFTWREVSISRYLGELVAGPSPKAAFLLRESVGGGGDTPPRSLRFDGRARRWVELPVPADLKDQAISRISLVNSPRLSFFVSRIPRDDSPRTLFRYSDEP